MSSILYPLKFKPILKDRIWGGDKLQTRLNKDLKGKDNIGESWELSGVEGSISVVSNGFLQGNDLNELIEVYMGDLVGERVFKKYGEEFPLLIKFIDANDDLSIQVHPNDELAAARHNSFGKSEMWYIMHAEPGAELISGFKHKTEPEQYTKAVENNSVLSLLASYQVNKGDVFYIPAGRVHAIGKGIMLAEIQQTSDLTYRIYDYDRTDAKGNKRDLHIEEALDAINFKDTHGHRLDYTTEENGASELCTTPFFSTYLLNFDKPIGRDYYHLDSFVILVCVEGEAEISFNKGQGVETIKTGETVLIPAELNRIDLFTTTGAKILEVHIPEEK
jgi:mannose-6-phosphate isomerase